MKTIVFRDKIWRVASHTKKKLILVPADRTPNPWRLKRVTAGFTQIEFAKLLGVNQSTICKVETGFLKCPEWLANKIEKVIASYTGA